MPGRKYSGSHWLRSLPDSYTWPSAVSPANPNASRTALLTVGHAGRPHRHRLAAVGPCQSHRGRPLLPSRSQAPRVPFCSVLGSWNELRLFEAMTSPLSMNVSATRVEPGSELIGSLLGRRPVAQGWQETLPPVGGRATPSGLWGPACRPVTGAVPAVNRVRPWGARACRRGSLGSVREGKPHHVGFGLAFGILVI